MRWLSSENIDWTEIGLEGTREVGTLLAYDETRQTVAFQCRPFNSMQEDGKRLIKKPVDAYGESIAEWEQKWYKKVINLGYESIPGIYSFNPLCLEKISGKNIYDVGGSVKYKEAIVDKIVSALNSLHSLETGTYNVFDLMETYYDKTFSRLSKIRDMIPFANEKFINVNGKVCHNPYFMKHDIRKLIKDLLLDCHYCLIHGDCTFSNMMLRDSGEVVLIDPRGYFGKTQYYGDPTYDWAKVYYSISGNYDCFNRKKFLLDIENDEVKLSIESNGWECVGDYFLSKINVDARKIKLLHVLIWLSLTTYAWEDYDSICGAFYNGCYLLEEFLEAEEK